MHSGFAVYGNDPSESFGSLNEPASTAYRASVEEPSLLNTSFDGTPLTPVEGELPDEESILTENNNDQDAPTENKGAVELSWKKKPEALKEEEPQESGQQLLDKALTLCQTSQELWAEGVYEKAVESLDQAYTSLLHVDTGGDPKLDQQKEEIRFMISKRILEIYSSRFTAVNGNFNEIPRTMNRYVEQEIKKFQTVERDFFIESYRRSGRYRDMITEKLREAGFPEELSWLPLIESGFKVKALSRARALGLWQFIPSTGYKFGLKRDTWIDERMDPEKATDAAIAYMKELHQIFGDWTTVLAAYNCGEGAVLRVIRSQQISYLDNFWDLFEKLPYETARYVPRFLATVHILSDPEKYGFTLEEIEHPIPYETVTINKSVQLKAVASKLDVSLDDLVSLNPELRYQATSNDPYLLKVPPETGELLLASLDQIPKWTPPSRRYIYHRVRRGETLSSIARRYRTSVRAIKSVNRIPRSNIIRIGQKLKIPVRGRHPV